MEPVLIFPTLGRGTQGEELCHRCLNPALASFNLYMLTSVDTEIPEPTAKITICDDCDTDQETP